ncbi:MAG: outer membrane protein transport protein [Polyangiaceae bacterium]|nr:outer membrane protein transport protein [Polyangiaceae bacterium]MCW5788793.1 outer membrane protein transport protein [Polyangiaceae bacterium]
MPLGSSAPAHSHPHRRRRTALAGALIAAGLLASSQAGAAGLYFSDRGVRGLARGGAMVAGADDAASVYYNPAGLAFTGNQLLLDAAWLNYSGTYQRKARLEQTDPNTGEPTGQRFVRTFEPVEGTSPLVPIPTVVYADPLGTERFNFALGAWAPYAAITSYPETVGGGRPAPQRYSLISLDGSALAIVGAYASYRPIDELALGVGVEVLGGSFETSVAFSSCVPDRFICAPEQPDFDAITKLAVGPIIAPSGVLGLTFVPSEDLRFGASYHLPFWIRSSADVKVRLPSSPLFDDARQEGQSARVAFDLPGYLRTGVEYRGLPDTRIELAFVWENWSAHDTISLKPEDIRLVGVEAFPEEYRIGDIELPRGFEDAYSLRLGGEHQLSFADYALDLRAGIMYEKSAVPAPYLSVTTVDVDKITVGLGGGLHIGKWRFDAMVARVFGQSVDVGVDEAQITPISPLRANPPDRTHTINAGRYEASALVLGVGLAYQFDQAEPALARAAEPPANTAPEEPTAPPAPEPPEPPAPPSAEGEVEDLD